MKGLSSLERVILECLGKKTLTYEEIQNQSGLHKNVCFNVIQTLIIRNIVCINGNQYSISEKMSALMLYELNSVETKYAESLEMIEALLDQKTNRHFRFKKIALDQRDEKLFHAMLINIELFLVEAHKKSQRNILLKDRKVIFWGVSDVKSLMNQIISGNNL